MQSLSTGPSPTIPVRIPAELREWLDERAERLNTSRSALLRTLIEQERDRVLITVPDQR